MKERSPVDTQDDSKGSQDSKEGGVVCSHRYLLIARLGEVEEHSFYDAGIIVKRDHAIDDRHDGQKIELSLDYCSKEKELNENSQRTAQ